MKSLPDRHYAALSGAERAAVALAALARDDAAELLRLKDTCPEKVYRIADPDYADHVDALLMLVLGAEAELRGWAATVMLFVWRGFDPAPAVQCMRAIDIALDRFAVEQGIDPAHLRAVGIPRHELVTFWLDDDITAPAPREALIESELQSFRTFWRVRVEARAAR